MTTMKPIALFLLILPALLSGAESWPQWRGPEANGHAGKAGYPSEWNKGKNVAWKSVLPGRGHSSPVHDGDTIWVTTAIETPASEAEKKERLKANKGLPTVTVLSKVSLRALRIDPKSGKVLKNVEIFGKSSPSGYTNLTATPLPPPSSRMEKSIFTLEPTVMPASMRRPGRFSGKTTTRPSG